MESGEDRFFDFGEFSVDKRRRVLSKNGEPVPLSPRNLDLLIVMLENEGRIVSHDELLDTVWEGTFVEQANLKNAISVLRRVLGEGANEGAYIRTVPRRGYTFVASVTVTKDDRSTGPAESEALPVTAEMGEPVGVAGEKVPVERPAGLPAASRSWRPVVGIAAIVVLAIVTLGVWRWRSQTSPRLSVENIKISRLTTKGDVNGAIVSPSGNYFLYATVENDGASLWVQQIATGSASRLTPKMTASFWFYTFSPDENYVYYTVDNNPDPAQNGYFKIALLGGSPQRVGEKGGGYLFSPDGKRILLARPGDGQTQYLTANPDLSDEKVVAAFGTECRIWSMQWAPDGASVLFAVRKFDQDKTVHYVVEFPAAGGAGRIIIPEMDKQITSAVWLPDKSSLLICLREVNAEIRQVWQYSPSTGEMRRVTNDDNSYKGLSMTRDGRSVVTITENVLAAAYVADGEKLDLKQIMGGSSRLGDIGWLGDGRLIYSATKNNVEAISIIDQDGAGGRQITAGNDGIWLFPRVSADGMSVVFASARNGRKQICRSDLDGRNIAQLTHYEGDVYNGKLLADGKTVIFEGAGPDHVVTLFRQNTGGEIGRLLDDSVDAWDISPDEKYVAYAANDPVSNRPKVFIKSIDSGWLYKILDIQPVALLRWTRDGKALTYDGKNGDSSELRFVSVDGGAPRVLASFAGEQIFSFDWSFDGKRLTMIRGKQLNDAVQITIAPQ